MHLMQGLCVSTRDFMVLQVSHLVAELDVFDDMVGPNLDVVPLPGGLLSIPSHPYFFFLAW